MNRKILFGCLHPRLGPRWLVLIICLFALSALAKPDKTGIDQKEFASYLKSESDVAFLAQITEWVTRQGQCGQKLVSLITIFSEQVRQNLSEEELDFLSSQTDEKLSALKVSCIRTQERTPFEKNYRAETAWVNDAIRDYRPLVFESRDSLFDNAYLLTYMISALDNRDGGEIDRWEREIQKNQVVNQEINLKWAKLMGNYSVTPSIPRAVSLIGSATNEIYLAMSKFNLMALDPEPISDRITSQLKSHINNAAISMRIGVQEGASVLDTMVKNLPAMRKRLGSTAEIVEDMLKSYQDLSTHSAETTRLAEVWLNHISAQPPGAGPDVSSQNYKKIEDALVRQSLLGQEKMARFNEILVKGQAAWSALL